MITGDYLENVSLPRVRKWPDSSEKCSVSVRVGCYLAIGRHYYVKIHEGSNPIWDCRDAGTWGRAGKAMSWRKCWDDTEGQGKIFEEVFDLRRQAVSFIEEIVDEHFPPEVYCVYINAVDMEEYFYEREKN